jgi:hypothetical protein
MLRKLFRISPAVAEIFDPSVIAESGVSARITALGESIADLISQLNAKYAARKGEDLFKATNKTTQALLKIGKPAKDLDGYGASVDDLYFLFRESIGTRLDGNVPSSFNHINDLRTDLRHDVDHGKASKVRAKRRKSGTTFTYYAGAGTPETIEPVKFSLVQSNVLSAIESDLRSMLLKSSF